MTSFVPQHHGRRDLGIEHQVAAVADHHDDFALGLRHLDADAAGDLVAHARVAVFHVVAAGTRRRARACAARPGSVPAAQTTMSCAADCGVRCAAPRRSLRRRTAAAGGSSSRTPTIPETVVAPLRRLRASPCPATPCRSSIPRGARRARRAPRAASPMNGGRAPFVRIESVDVDRDELRLRRTASASRS